MASKKIKVRPGKTQSKIGFVVGIVFVLIECFGILKDWIMDNISCSLSGIVSGGALII